jgi:site-specific recombinase XerD
VGALERTEVSGLSTDLDDLMGEAYAFAAASRADATIRAYRSDWAHFAGFCERHALNDLPADPATVALYVTDLARSLRPSTINRRIAAISIQHKREGLDTPTVDPRVREIMKGIRRRLTAATDEAAPARIGEVRRMVAHLPTSLAGRRDRAVLLVGFASALRGSELVGLNVEDMEDRDEGLVLVKRRSKTDQEGLGARVAVPYGSDPQTCPVRALRRWLEDAQISTGALFRAVDRHGNVSAGRLTQRAVALIVKRSAERAGLDGDRYSAHSLRAGFVTTAAANGANERAIAAQTGHRSMEVLRRYVRHATVFTDNAANNLGL